MIFPGCTKAQDIALNKSYVLSSPPNYPLSAPASDKSSLTDGVYTTFGNFWTKPTTVGWQHTNKVTLDIDLESSQLISEVTFNTARRIQAGVYFPANIYIFLSNDNHNFIYAGDAAENPDNQPGDYEVKRFALNDLNQSARYVRLTIIPKGLFVFCDEIEVIKGQKNISGVASNLIFKDSLNKKVDSLKSFEFNHKDLIQMSNKLLAKSPNMPGKRARDLEDISVKLSDKNLSGSDFQSLKNKLEQSHALMLNSNFKTSFIVEKFNPWDTINEIHEPKENLQSINFTFKVLNKGVQYGAFVLTNSQSSPQQFFINIKNSNPNINDINLFNVGFVPGLNFNKVADPLIPLTKDITIDPGISKLILIKITGKKEGSGQSSVIVNSVNKKFVVNISSRVLSLSVINNVEQLSANNWAYLHYPMLKDREAEAAIDLQLHQINTIVIPPAFIPNGGINSYKPFLNYLGNFKSIKNILLFTNYADQNNYKQFGSFMSDGFKSNFIEWYHNMIKVVQDNGFSNSQIYLYPYDEVHANEIQDYKNFSTWVKSAIPGIKLYATLTNKESINNILPLVDIAQIQSNNSFSDLPLHHCEIWVYSVENSSRSLSPYSYYRLMAWNAFANNITGIGFWNYADEGADDQLNLITNPWINPLNSYSVIYDGPDKEIISSRRWEAFRFGIEDYSIMELYAKKYGIDKAKSLANQVLANPTDLNKADSIREQMLNEL